MIAEKLPGIESLSIREKLLLANELWEQVEAGKSDADNQADILQLLDQRYAAYARDPSSAVRWEDFKTQFSDLK